MKMFPVKVRLLYLYIIHTQKSNGNEKKSGLPQSRDA